MKWFHWMVSHINPKTLQPTLGDKLRAQKKVKEEQEATQAKQARLTLEKTMVDIAKRCMAHITAHLETEDSYTESLYPGVGHRETAWSYGAIAEDFLVVIKDICTNGPPSERESALLDFFKDYYRRFDQTGGGKYIRDFCKGNGLECNITYEKIDTSDYREHCIRIHVWY